MTTIERLQQAAQQAKNRRRAQRQLLLCLDAMETANQQEGLNLAVIDIVKRLDAMASKRTAPEHKGGKLTSQQAADMIGIWKGSLSALVQMGKITPVNPDAVNGSGLFYDRAHIANFLANNTSGEITRMLSEYRNRPRKPRMKRAS